MVITIPILGWDTPICRIRMVLIAGHLVVHLHLPTGTIHLTPIVHIFMLTPEFGIVLKILHRIILPSLVAVSIP